MSQRPIDQRQRDEVSGIAMMVNGLKLIHEANGGDTTEVARCICGAVGSYMAHIAQMGLTNETVSWVNALAKGISLSFSRTSENMRKRAAAVPSPQSLQ